MIEMNNLINEQIQPSLISEQNTNNIFSAYGSVNRNTANLSINSAQFDVPRGGRTQDHTFTRDKWAQHGNNVLLSTTERVDRVCHTLRQTRRKFGVCPLEMRELSLIIAVIERAIYGYGRRYKRAKQKIRLRNTPDIYNNSLSIRYFESNVEWRHPGGIVSLLEIIGRVLRKTDVILKCLSEVASIKEFYKKSKLIWGITIILIMSIANIDIQQGVGYVLNYLKKIVLSILKYVGIKVRLPKFIIGIIGIIYKSFKKFTHNQKIDKLSRIINKFRLIIIPTTIYYVHQIYLKYHLNKLKKLNKQLHLIILHWQLCMEAMVPSNRLDLSVSVREKYSQIMNEKNIGDIYLWVMTHGMLFVYDICTANILHIQYIIVPPSGNLDSCFWYSHEFRLKLLKRMMDVAYATVSRYYTIFGTYQYASPLSIPILLYYTFDPNRASQRANEFLEAPDIRIIRLFYSALDSWFARKIALQFLPKLKLIPKLGTALTFTMSTNASYDPILNEWNNLDNDPNNPWTNIKTLKIKLFHVDQVKYFDRKSVVPMINEEGIVIYKYIYLYNRYYLN